MIGFNETTEDFIKDTMTDCISEIRLRCKRYSTDQELTKLDQNIIEHEIKARLAYEFVKEE